MSCIKNLSYLKLKSILTNLKQVSALSRNLSALAPYEPVEDSVNPAEYPEVDPGEYLSDAVVSKMKIPKALDTCTEDLSYLGPNLRPTFNFASYVNQSPTLQELVKLGVQLWRIEANPASMECILKRNFEDMKPYIQFLHDCGVPPDEIGRFITKNPRIFDEDMDDLKTRIRYLRAHNFTRENIARIITVHPQWLNFDTKFIDNRLGFFQNEFRLSGEEVRFVTQRKPVLITYNSKKLRENIFAVREQMGFYPEEMRDILKNKPAVYSTDRCLTLRNFDYVHNEMMISQELISKMPLILLSTLERIQSRNLFLKSLKRDQYDPTKPLYVSLDDVACPTDEVFCSKSARVSLKLYDMFLRSL